MREMGTMLTKVRNQVPSEMTRLSMKDLTSELDLWM